MMYDYRCTNCQEVYEIWQSISDIHDYECPVCGQNCVREWNTAPSVQVSHGFFSWQFSTGGDWVSGTRDYDEKIAKVNTLHGMDKYLGMNNPKDEYVEARQKKIEADRKRSAREIAETQEYMYELKQQGRTD